MTHADNINTFNEFWPAYLREHANPASRGFHIAGTVLSLATAAALLSCGMVFFLVLAIVPAQLGAFIGHKLSPRHETTVVESHPDWAAVASVKMFALAVTGRLGRELDRLSARTPALSTAG